MLAFCSAGVFRIAVLALCSAGCRCWPCVLLVDGAGFVVLLVDGAGFVVLLVDGAGFVVLLDDGAGLVF